MPDTLDAHFRVYTTDGTLSSFDAMVDAMAGVAVVFIGETHDDPTTHLLQARLLEAAHGRFGQGVSDARPVVLSLEMFERDVQLVLDEYLAGLITASHFERASRPWQNYGSDYQPMVEFARSAGLRVVAANAPRRYVNRVTREGPGALLGLPAAARAFLPPLPYAGPSAAYKAEWDALMAKAMAAMPPRTDTTATHPPAADSTHTSQATSSLHGGASYMLDAQSLWDASMAHAIATQLMATPDALVLHLAGGFHVQNGTGTPEHLARYRPGTGMLIISMQPHNDVDQFDEDTHAGLGDFIVLTNATLPRTYKATF